MRLKLTVAILGYVLSFNIASAETTLTLSKAVKRLIAYYPTLQVARLKTEQANWEIRNVKNQLSWKLNGSAGVVHDVSAFGTPFDRFEASASLNRKLSSGHSLGFSGRYQYNDDSFVLNNNFPNPSQSIDFDINYRIPFGKGEGNDGYHKSLVIAEKQKEIELLNKKAILKSLTDNIIILFHEIDNLEQRLKFTTASINRSRRLKEYIARNKDIGIYEKKDVLESEAQLLKVSAQKENILLAMVEQKNSLRKLLGIEPAESVKIEVENLSVPDSKDMNILLDKAEKDNPRIQIKSRLLDIADANIQLSLGENNDRKDLVFSLGGRSLYGDSETDNVSEQDYAAQLRFEYEYDLGNHAYVSKIEQAKRQKDIALQEIRLDKEELKYQLTALLDKIIKQRVLIKKYQQHNRVSQEKLKDATVRHRQGRIDTTQLIQFENDLHLANLDLSFAKTDLSRSEASLALLTGELLPRIDVETQ